MNKLHSVLLIVLMLSSCQPVSTAVPTLPPMPTRIATFTPTIAPTPTPRIYTLRIEFSSTSDWSNLSILDSSSVLGFRLVDEQGDLKDFSVEKTYLAVNQTLADAEALKEVSITADYYISGDPGSKSIPFLLGKGAINGSTVSFYKVLNGSSDLLLDEVYREGAVTGNENVNPYRFSFELAPLFQDVTAIAGRAQSEAGTGKLIFEYYRTAYEKVFPDLNGEINIFVSNADGTDLSPVTNGLKGFNRIEDISPDGRLVLISSRSSYPAKGDLYVIHLDLPGADPIRIVGGVETQKGQGIFLDNARIAYIGKGRQGYGFYTNNLDGTDPKRIGSPVGKVWWIVSSDDRNVYWGAIQNKYFRDSFGFLYAYGDTETLWWTDLNGAGQGKLESNGQQIIGSYAFSSDGRRLAWIPTQSEPGCTAGSFYTKWITEGTYTEYAALPASLAARHGISASWLGQTIDMEWVNTYVRKCFIMYVASVAGLDNPTQIVLMPPANLIRGDFTFGKEYNLRWKPDGSTLLLFNGGKESYFTRLVHEPLLYHANLVDPEPELTEYRHSLFSRSSAGKTGLLDLSPDGRRVLVTNGAGRPNIRILDLDLLTFSDSFGNLLAPDADVRRIGSIYWLP